MRNSFKVWAASAALALAAVPASAATISMDPDGAGALAPVLISLIDPSPGNGISLGLNAGSIPGSTGDFFYQANMGIAANGSTNVFASGLGGAYNFSFAVGLTEKIDQNFLNPDGTNTLKFLFDGTTTNFFEIWANPTQAGNNLTGDCFRADCGNILVLKGSFLNDGSFSSSFTNNQTALQALDQFGVNNYPGVQTVIGNGGFQGNVGNFSFINAAFFPAGLTNFVFAASSQQKLAFDQADPSACFFGVTAGVCDGYVGVGSVGAVNGAGTNTIVQTDGNISFQDAAAVPEPATMSMLGLGLLAAAAVRRSRKK